MDVLAWTINYRLKMLLAQGRCVVVVGITKQRRCFSDCPYLSAHDNQAEQEADNKRVAKLLRLLSVHMSLTGRCFSVVVVLKLFK